MDLISREALVEELNELYNEQTVSKYSYSRDCKKTRLGIALAINKVKTAPTVEAIPKGACEQVRWERDMAIQQLNDYGVQLGEKVDVQAVRHGKWENYPSHAYRRCSLCKKEWEKPKFNVRANYCPNCGAKMDGD